MNNDIRVHHKLHGPNIDVVAAILEGRPPQFAHADAQPGFDCLIVVLRRIYSHVMLDLVPPPAWMQASEEANPILRLAWHLFGDDVVQREEAIKARHEAFGALNAKGISHKSSFEEICSSSLMNKTFWSQDEFRLTDILHCIDTGAVADGTPDDIASTSLLELNHVETPGRTLQEVVDDSFGVITHKGKQILSRPNDPWIVRVTYTPDSSDTERFDLNKLRTLHLPIWKLDEQDPDISYLNVGKNEYFLLAVVRLRDNKHPGEYVRTYGIHGSNIVGERQPPSIVNHDWSVKDGHGKYMLFYGFQTMKSAGDPRRFSEVAPPTLTDNDAKRISTIDRHLKDLWKSSQEQKAQPTPPTSSATQVHQNQPSQDDVDKAMPEPPSQQEPADAQTATGSPRIRAAQTSEGEVSKRRSRGKRRGKVQGDTGLGSGEPPGSPKTAPQRKGKPDRSEASRDARRDAA
ncbi:uncharacterized protein FSUBG_13437 [Fusarium subglutinans]|uniref:Uncharacterized protein n=1 Tax=Gibberella subglutinans TaxID=42677 RepID=A0A8H5NVY1_GIBSU|nr:uncharacterized protein FSUBG_13437 [Fusarium subglutinans]KAF5580284.1 hypothetical protein FSUBG_13437 [Fusarium subglutinans]